ncbi:glycine receptor subunit alpha-4-like [Lytechinus pictus]|uniref:glycine receptor subunit alpha-4-like n=1 Tax=Lytechinus pictus TaxID=7653 RepID=UPI0030BA20D6
MESATARSPDSQPSSVSMSEPGGGLDCMSEMSSQSDPPSGGGHGLSGPSAILHEILQTYDSRVRPNYGGAATNVACSINIISLDSVTEITMDFGMTILLKEYWNDPRLAYGNKSDLPYLGSGKDMIEQIWAPDLFFANEKQANYHDVTQPNRLVRIYPNGDIYYSMKLTLVLSCRMNFEAFPMDMQRCKTVVESYQSTDNELTLEWKEPEAVVLNTGIMLPQFSVIPELSHGPCTDLFYTTGNYSCIEFSFVLIRELTFYVVQAYMPTALLVIISWVSFWIDISQAAARVSLGVTTILTMTTTTTGYAGFAGLPKVSYTKAIDIWFDACLAFAIASLFEYSVVHYLWTKDRTERQRQKVLRKSNKKFNFPSSCLGRQENESPNHHHRHHHSAPSGRSTDYIVAIDENKPYPDPRFANYNYGPTYRPVRNNQYRANYDGDAARMDSLDEDVEHGVSYTPNNRRDCHVPGEKEHPVFFGLFKSSSSSSSPSQGSHRSSKLLALRIDQTARVFFPLTFLLLSVAYWSYYLNRRSVSTLQ